MFEDFFFRVIAAGALAWALTAIAAEFGPLVRIVLMGWGVTERATLRLVSLLLDWPLSVTSAVIYVLAYRYLRRPLAAGEAVLLGAALAYWAAFVSGGLCALIRQGRKATATRLQRYVWPLLIHPVFWALVVVLFPLYWLLAFAQTSYRAWLSALSSDKLEEAMAPLLQAGKAFAADIQQNPAFAIVIQIVTGSVLIVGLFALYWLLGVRGAPMRTFLQFSLYLFLACLTFQFVFTGMRKPEPTQLRWINPFALAGSFVITFTFYVAIYGSDAERQAGAFLATVGALLLLLWYVCFLSRREVTIGELRDAVVTPDGDFQTDTAMLVVGHFYKFVVLLQPVFLGAHVLRAPATTAIGASMLTSWLHALATAVGMITILALAFLAIWARNIAKDVLVLDENGTRQPIAGADGRDDYPVYREQLAVAALPYCVFVPAMIFGLFALTGGLPLRIAGFSGLWLDGLVFVLLMVALGAMFVQLPFRWGASAWWRERAMQEADLRERLENEVAAAHAQPPKARTTLTIIAGELTLQRLREAERERDGRQVFKFSVFGESLSGTDAVAFVRGLVVTAVTAGAGVLLNALLQIPAT